MSYDTWLWIQDEKGERGGGYYSGRKASTSVSRICIDGNLVGKSTHGGGAWLLDDSVVGITMLDRQSYMVDVYTFELMWMVMVLLLQIFIVII